MSSFPPTSFTPIKKKPSCPPPQPDRAATTTGVLYDNGARKRQHAPDMDVGDFDEDFGLDLQAAGENTGGERPNKEKKIPRTDRASRSLEMYISSIATLERDL